LTVLKTFPSDCIDTIITSPPYWGLRDYGVEGQIGLEPTLEKYIRKMSAVTKELKRVLKPTGVMFWNHGDSYNSHSWAGKSGFDKKDYGGMGNKTTHQGRSGMLNMPTKCLMLQNYRLILKMVDEQGWILRNSIVWHKPNAMPSSVKDRFSNSYEPVFMLVKKKKYWFDLGAVRVAHKGSPIGKDGVAKNDSSNQAWGGKGYLAIHKHNEYNPLGKNPGDLWRIPTHPFPQAHFATFPPKLIEPMIKSSCPMWICEKCGEARVRISEKKYVQPETRGSTKISRSKDKEGFRPKAIYSTENKTIGWTGCDCKADWKSGVVLDPFMGAGTTGMVAKELGRNYVGIELSKEYIKIAEARINKAVYQPKIV